MSPAQPRRKILGINYPQYAIDEFKALEADFDVHYFIPEGREQVIENIARLCKEEGPFDAGYTLFGTGPYSPFDPTLLGPLFTTPGKCGLWAQCGAGYDDVSVDWLTENGCYVSNTPTAVTEPTADLAIFLMLAILRNTTQGELHARQGTWRSGFGLTTDPNGLRLGIIGMGAIGSDISRKARVFGMEVVYNNRHRLSDEDEKKAGASYVDFDELLRTSDVISVNCPLTPATRHLLSAKEFAKMKDGVFFVNTSRGAVIDEPALIEALESGKVARAGLDVFEGEPNICEYFKQSLKVTLQPHVGALTKGAILNGEREIFANLRKYFADGIPVNPVNKLSK